MMKKPIYFGSMTLLAFPLIYMPVANTQNVTSNASYPMGNAGARINNTASELGKNASEAVQAILNKTAEVGKKIVGGATDVVSNISVEVK